MSLLAKGQNLLENFHQISAWKLYDFDLHESFFMEKIGPNMQDFQFYFLSKFQIFLISSSWAAENMKGSLFC
jgi:hypothetical protein